MSYWEVNKLMCFMTYYPFTNFFFDALMKFLNMIKVERMLQLTSPAMMENVARHQDLDHSFTQSVTKTSPCFLTSSILKQLSREIWRDSWLSLFLTSIPAIQLFYSVVMLSIKCLLWLRSILNRAFWKLYGAAL